MTKFHCNFNQSHEKFLFYKSVKLKYLFFYFFNPIIDLFSDWENPSSRQEIPEPSAAQVENRVYFWRDNKLFRFIVKDTLNHFNNKTEFEKIDIPFGDIDMGKWLFKSTLNQSWGIANNLYGKVTEKRYVVIRILLVENTIWKKNLFRDTVKNMLRGAVGIQRGNYHEDGRTDGRTK